MDDNSLNSSMELERRTPFPANMTGREDLFKSSIIFDTISGSSEYTGSSGVYPLSVFPYTTTEMEDGTSKKSIATMYDDLKSIDILDSGAGGFDYTREFNVGEPGFRPSAEITFNTPPLSSFMIPNDTELTTISDKDESVTISKQFDLL